MDSIIEIEHISYAYEASHPAAEKLALRDVSLFVQKGESVAILGANGSGKSTLARLIAGLEAPDKGTVKLFGKACKNNEGLNPGAYADARKKTAMVFQEAADQILGLSVAEDIAFGPENLHFPDKRIQEIVHREVERFGLSGLEDVNPNGLSGGQQQKLVLASALAMEPQLLVLDEAAAHLDVAARHHLFSELFQYTQEGACTLVYITHDLIDALRADRILVLKEGSLVAEGTPQTVFSSSQQVASWNIAMPPQLVLQQELQERGVSLPFTLDEESLCQNVQMRLSSQEPKGDSVQQEEFVQQEGFVQQDESAQQSEHDKQDESARQGELVRQGESVKAAVLQAPEVLSIRHLSFAYEQTSVLQDLSLSLPKGDLCALIGEAGTGKTTLLRILSGLLANFEGEIMCEGICPVEYTRLLKRPRRNRMLSRHVGYVMQAPERQLFAQTVLEDVSYGPKNLGLSLEAARKQALNALEVLGIAHLAQASPFELSGGQARLVAIAGITAMNAPLLLMDEPFAGLDERASNALRALLASLVEQQHTVLFTTHDMDEVARATRVVLLAEKTIQESAPAPAFFSHADQLQAFGVTLPWAFEFSKKLNLPKTFFPASISALADEIAKRVQPKR